MMFFCVVVDDCFLCVEEYNVITMKMYSTKQMNISTDAYICFADAWIDHNVNVLDKYNMTAREIWYVIDRVWYTLPHDDISYWFDVAKQNLLLRDRHDKSKCKLFE
jgi:hypothetical protein